ncbi:MAG: cytochrome c1, partial [Alphaproteobacteria bacterium]
PQGMYYNPYFVGGLIAMAPPLKDGAVEYQDGTASTADQMARDVVNFLQWAAEPEMETRKRMGVRVMIFLLIMTGFFYVAKKRIWSKVE